LKIREVPFAAIDFESAGTAPGLTDEPVQIAIVHWNNGRAERILDSFLQPTREVTWAAREVHGISNEQLRGAPRLLDLWPAIRDAMRGRWIVAHGAATEKRFLRAFPLHGFGPWIDTLSLARAVFPTLPSHALGEAFESLGLELNWENFRWHDAASDAAASLVLLRHLIESGGLDDEPAELLTRPNLRDYFRDRNK
jgi:DNA polymerase-3 subunit epsilon